MINDLGELAKYISKRDKITTLQAEELIAICQMDMESALASHNYALAQTILQGELELSPDYIRLFCDDLK